MPDSAGPGRTLKVETRDEGRARVLKVVGQLTETEAPQFLEMLKRETSAGRARVVLDMDGIEYMSSAGLGALVSVHPTFIGSGVRFILAGTNPKVRKLLALTSLDKLIESAETVPEAISRP
ncbi:MAG TPA: STAS domain-containing protein [Planctomycetota bacterium]|nr:STAS domain-containing protein [Planctomycetota bacterium]